MKINQNRCSRQLVTILNTGIEIRLQVWHGLRQSSFSKRTFANSRVSVKIVLVYAPIKNVTVICKLNHTS